MVKAIELRRGQAVNIDGQAYVIVDTDHVAKGNKRSYIQAKIRNVKTGQLLDQRMRVDDDFEAAFLERKEVEYLYSDGTGHIMMDLVTYDQITIDQAMMGQGADYLKPNTVCQAVICDGLVVDIELPNTVELEVTDTTPVVKGATATNQNKDATLETGLRVKVPPFVDIGEKIRVDTRTGDYIERVR